MVGQFGMAGLAPLGSRELDQTLYFRKRGTEPNTLEEHLRKSHFRST
jgi:hypothetical protein